MKKWMIGFLFAIVLAPGNRVHAQAFEVQQLLLNVEKLAQLKSILADLKKGYEIVSSGYTRIKNISEGNFSMHQLFLDGLLKVSPVVKNYKRITDIIRTQLKIVREYKAALRQVKESGHFSAEEITYFEKVYSNLLSQSLKSLDALGMVITSGGLRMSDAERLTAIDDIWKEAEKKLIFLRHFNNEARVLALQRARERKDITTMKGLHGLIP